jgi:hypothetical protein
MSRNHEFRSRPAPLPDFADAQLLPDTVGGALSFFNPTRARYEWKAPPGAEGVWPKTLFQWRSRDNRKGASWPVLPGYHSAIEELFLTSDTTQAAMPL